MALSTASFDFVCDLLRRQAAIELSAGKEYLVATRLGQLANKEGIGGVDELVERLKNERSEDLQRRAVEALTTNETSFFRDIKPYEALRATLIPELMQLRKDVRRIKIWCAACSTGQEPYSLAMMLRLHFPTLQEWQVDIVATDLNEQVLAQARAGTYRQLEVGRGLPAQYLAMYMQRVGATWQVKDEIRRLVTFQSMNLAGAWSVVGPFDMILIRNVLIYFSNKTRQEILTKAAYLLYSHGALMLGAAESCLGLDVPLKRRELGATSVYVRTG